MVTRRFSIICKSAMTHDKINQSYITNHMNMNTWIFRDSLLLHNATTLALVSPEHCQSLGPSDRPPPPPMPLAGSFTKSSKPSSPAYPEPLDSRCEYGWGWKWMMKMRRIRRDPCKGSEECSRFKLFFSLCATSSIKIISRILLQHGPTGCLAEGLHIFISWELKNVGVQNGGVFHRQIFN